MKYLSLLWLLATGIALSSGESCENMWEADYSEQNVNICDVPTKNGEKCAFPFTYQGTTYKHCVTGPISERLPACKTTSGQFSECIVPTSAVIYGVTTRKAGSYSLNGASLKGGTLVWIVGTRFAPEAFTTSPSATTSNVVYLTNDFTSYSCEIFPDATTTTQVTCYTPKDMTAGTYRVQVAVKGNIIPFYQYTDQTDAVITISNSHTPKINSITPKTGLPGTFVDIRGDFKTSCYLRDTAECADDAGARITRLYVGGQQCILINSTSNELYHPVSKNLVKCKLDKPEVGYFEASMLVSNEFGRALTARDAFYVSPDEQLYNFQTFAEVTNVSPQVGSTEGGTRVTITGKYLYTDENVPANIDIGGKPCKVIDFNMDDLLATRIVCETAPETTATHYGNRGITLISDNVFTAANDLATATPSNNAVKSTLSSALIKDHGSQSVTVWMKSFLYPRRNSTYKFSFSTDGVAAKLFISTDQDVANKQPIANDGTVNLIADTYYYFEAVASKSGGNLDLEVNAKMLDTILTDVDSDYVSNELQEVEVTSTLIPEKYSIPIESTVSSGSNLTNDSNVTVSNSSIVVPSIQQVIVKTLGGGAPFSLGLLGAETLYITYGAPAKEVQDALNDMPFLHPNMAQVTEQLASDGVSKNYTVTFSADLGDLPKLTETTGYVNATIDILQAGANPSAKSYIIVDGRPSGLFDMNTDSGDEIKSAVSESFGIRCPGSIQMNNESDSMATYDYETCSWGNNQLKDKAFCGKCSNTGNRLFSNLNSSLTYEHLCFAYKFETKVTWVTLQIVDPLWKTINNLGFGIDTIADNEWHYNCWNIKEKWEAKNPSSSYSPGVVKVYAAYLYPRRANMFTDVVSVRKTLPLGFNTNEPVMRLSTRRVFPSIQFKSGTLSVTKSNTAVEFQFRPTNCTSNLPLIVLKNGPSITQVSAASPAVTGTFNLAWDGTNLNSIAFNISESELSTLFQSIPGFGNARVIRVGDCSGYKWSVKWLAGGDKSAISVTGNNLNGNNVNIAANSALDGGASFNPITDDLMRTYHDSQQVAVMINNIPTKCADCTFVYNSAATPAISTINVADTANIQISGSGFGNRSEDNIVMIGDVPCSILTSTTTSISCAAGNNSIGSYPVTLNVLGKGKATIQTPTMAVFSLNTVSVSPSTGSTGGGNKLEIIGTGFSAKSTVTVDGNPCPVVTASYSVIVCLVPQSDTASNKVVDVVVTEQAFSSTVSAAYTYDFNNTPQITSITPNVLRVSGGETVVAAGTNLPVLTSNVKLEDREISIISSNSTHLVVRSPSLAPGNYKLNIVIPNVGRIRVSTSITYKLYISSVSPKIGSIRGGTNVNVYGDGFDSVNCQNNMVTFGKQPCKISNCTSNMIKCQTSTAFITHQVTNDGSDPYHGKGYAWSAPFLTVNIGDSVRWSWMPPTGISSVKYQVIQVADALAYEPTGFTTTSASARGSFTFEFNQAGTYHYWSGYVESSRQILFRGTINVVSSSDKTLEADMKLNGFMAQKCAFPFEYNNVNYTSCTNVDNSFQWCSPTAVYDGQKIRCDPIEVNNVQGNCVGDDIVRTTCGQTADEITALGQYKMLFTSCASGTPLPAITSVSRNQSSFDDDIVITGSGFKTTACEQKVLIGDHECTVTAATATELTCQIGQNSGLYANFPYNLEVLVSNLGFALKSENHIMNFLPKVTSLSTNTGSTAGGTKVVINGDGFLPSATVAFIGTVPYYIGKNAHITHNTIEINTLPSSEGSHDIRVTVNNINAVMISQMQFSYAASATPVFNSVSPSAISSASTITLSGEKFGSNQSAVIVKIGHDNCVVTGLTTTEITCDVAGIAAGEQLVKVTVGGQGNAKTTQAHFVSGTLNVTSMTPNLGSIHGGQLVTLTGNGFDMNTRIAFGNYPCNVEKASASKLTCRTTDSTKEAQSTQAPPTSTAQSTTTASTSTTTSTAAANQCQTQFQNAMLQAHNEKRALHENTGSVSTNMVITGVAQAYADYLAQNTKFEHSSGSGYGENLAKSWSSDDLGTLADCGTFGTYHTKLWYDEIQFYDYNNPGQKKAGSESEMIGHFTQVVWNNTLEIGCGLAKGSDNFIYSVCNYSPPGNYIGAQNYQNNVLPLASRRRRRSVANIGQSINLNSYGQVFTSSDLMFTFTDSASPEITSVSPNSGSGGSITLAGSGFGLNQSDVVVTIGMAHCNITSLTNTQIVCDLAANSAGSHQVKVYKMSEGNSNTNIEYTYSLTSASLSANEGSIGGGLVLVITGSGFSASTDVKICNKKCVYRANTFNSYSCVLPSAEVKDADSTCTVSVTENGMSASGSFTYRLSLTPTLTSVSPLRGGTGGGTLLTITGSGFPNSEGSVTVTVAGALCNISSISSTQIQCRTEPYRFSSIIANVQVSIDGSGLALNDGSVKFEYIDLWSSRFTWGGLTPPGEGEIAVISAGQHIYFDAASTPVLKGIIIQGGSLIFDDNQDVALNVEYVIIIGGGKFQVGTEDKPFQHNAVITMHGHVRSVELPTYGAKVIALRNGTLDLHGKPVGVTWTKLGSTASAGDNQIVLQEAIKWPVGSQIVIATTGDKFTPGESELAFITGKSSDNTTITLDHALKFGHLGEERTVGSNGDFQTVSLRAEVGLLSRNVKFQGWNDKSWNRLKNTEGCPKGFNPAEFATQTCFLGRYGPELGSDEFGGIIFIFAGQNQPKNVETVVARLSNTEFYHVGQAFKKGRYPIHFHMNGDMRSSYVKECAIHESFNRAINIHASNYLKLTRNVIYNIMGGAYFLEDGVEIGNEFMYNLAVFVRTSSSLLNEDVTPAAFWATNANNTYLHNAVAGSTHFGWWYRVLDHPEGPSFRTDYCPKKIPFGRHFNNSVHSTGRFGIWVFPGMMPTVSGACSDSRPSAAVFDTFTTWNNDKGAEFVNSNNIQFHRFTVYDHFDTGIDVKIIKGNQDENSYYKNTFFDESLGALIADSVIIGNSIQGQNSVGRRGFTWAWDRGELLQNTKFYNYPTGTAMDVTAIAGVCMSKCGGWYNHVKGLTFNNVLYRHSQRWHGDNIMLDLDGSLTGKAGDIVVFKDDMTSSDPRCRVSDDFENGIVCSDMNTQLRFAFNKYEPNLALRFNVTNSEGKSFVSERLLKRLTHKLGFMFNVEAKKEYTMFFDNAERVTNMSYKGAIFNLKPGDYIIVKHPLKKRPDRLQISTQLSEQSDYPLTYANNNNGDWYWNNATYEVNYIIKNVDTKPFLDVNLAFSVVKCRYVGCKPPESPGYRAPIAGRPDDAIKFSDYKWGRSSFLENTNSRKRRSAANGIPEDGDSIIIPEGVYMVLDRPLPKLNILKIEGYLEFDKSMNHYLEAAMIFINGGELIIGWENDPIETNVSIVLTGEKSSLNYRLPNGLEKIGGKGIGVYGGLTIYGKPRVNAWTKLESTASAGSKTIQLIEAVDWVAGDEIMITTTSFILEHTETMFIAAVSGDKKTITLTQPLVYEHLAYRETFSDGQTGYNIAAAVGLLTRNVKIIAQEYAQQQSDLYGFRIVSGDYSAIINDFPTYFKGFVRLTDVEFVRFGQFDRSSGEDAKFGVLISNLGKYNVSRPTFVRNCAFHHGLGVAIGVFSSSGMKIENNVIHRTVNYGIRLEGNSNEARNNLLGMNQWGSTFDEKEAKVDRTAWGAIDATHADSAIIVDNYIAGSERSGLNYKGDVCAGDSLPGNLPHQISGNTIYGAGLGVVIESLWHYKTLNCIRISGFTIYKSQYFGVYYQGNPELVVENNVLIGNKLGVYTIIHGPSPQSHIVTNKKLKTRDMLVIGSSAARSCENDIVPRNLSDTSQIFNVFGSGPSEKGRGGLVFPTFIIGSNAAPEKPWANIMSYNQLGGEMIVSNITFANWNTTCGHKDSAIITSRRNEDGQHPLTLSNMRLFNVDSGSKVWYHRPNVGKVNPSDCVDMDCDGLKKNLISDTDGSFLGSPGAVISQSEFEWGINGPRGLGDFRIPSIMLSYPNGSLMNMRQVYDIPGIVRDEQNCTYQSGWQAYECHGLRYKVLIIESMDHDTEDRRLSPVAIRSNGHTRYLDLINGPQDHGWCFGYTCQKRVSAFMAIVAADLAYDVVLTSTPPEKLRMRILNADSTFKISLSMTYSVSQRIDLYKDSTYVEPSNSYFVQGAMQLRSPTPRSLYVPTYQNTSGSNVFIKEDMKIYFSTDGSSVIDLKIAPVLFVSFGLPAITPEEFFNEATIVGNFALLLGVDASKIRRVEIVRASRRRRDTSSLNYVKIIIEENASTDLNDTAAVEAQKQAFNALDAKIGNLFVTNQLQENAKQLLNVTIASLAVQKPGSNTTAKAVAKEANIQVVNQASGCSAQIPCSTQPLIKIIDENGDIVDNIGNDAYPWIVVANLTSSSDPNAKLLFETEVNVVAGYATFTKLGISEISTFTISYKFKTPEGVNSSKFDPKELQTPAVTSSLPVLSCKQYGNEVAVSANTPFNMTINIVDKLSEVKVENISWANYVWQAEVQLHELGYHKASGVLSTQNATVRFDPVTGFAQFDNLVISANGMYVLTFAVKTLNNEYSFSCFSKYIEIRAAALTYDATQAPNYVLKYEGDFNKINAAEVAANVYNYMAGYNVSVAGVSVVSGSVYITFYSSDSSTNLIDTLLAAGLAVDPNLVYSYASINDQIINCTNCVVATTAQPDSDDDDISHIAVGAIVGGLLGGIAALIVVFVSMLGYKEYKKIKVKKMTVSPSGTYHQTGNPKTKMERLLEKMLGTTDQNYSSGAPKTPNVYDRSYLDGYGDEPLPVVPNAQNYDNSDFSKNFEKMKQ